MGVRVPSCLRASEKALMPLQGFEGGIGVCQLGHKGTQKKKMEQQCKDSGVNPCVLYICARTTSNVGGGGS